MNFIATQVLTKLQGRCVSRVTLVSMCNATYAHNVTLCQRDKHGPYPSALETKGLYIKQNIISSAFTLQTER